MRTSFVAFLFIAGCSSVVAIQDAGDDDGSTDASVDGTVDASHDASVDATIGDAGPDTTLGDAAIDSSDAGADADAAADADASFDAGLDVDPSCPYIPIVDSQIITAGTPQWQPSEVLLYIAPIGDPSDASAAVASTLAVIKPNHTWDSMKQLYKSADAHAPPYDNEFSNNILDSGFVNTGCFSLSDLTAPSGLLIIINLVPTSTAPTGISYEQPDGGPVIEFLSGVLNVSGELDIDGGLVDPYFGGTYPKAAYVYDYSGPWAGFGHFLISFGENDKFSPNPLTTGSYSFTYTLNDGSGYTTQTIHFVVK